MIVVSASWVKAVPDMAAAFIVAQLRAGQDITFVEKGRKRPFQYLNNERDGK